MPAWGFMNRTTRKSLYNALQGNWTYYVQTLTPKSDIAPIRMDSYVRMEPHVRMDPYLLSYGRFSNPEVSVPVSTNVQYASHPHLPGSAASRSTKTITISFLPKYQCFICFSRIASASGDTFAGISWLSCFTMCQNF